MFVRAWVKASKNFRMFGIISKIQEYEKQEDKKPLQKLAFICGEMIKQLAKNDMNEITSAAQRAIELSKQIQDNQEVTAGRIIFTIGVELKKASNNELAAESFTNAMEIFLKCQNQDSLALETCLQASLTYEGLGQPHNTEKILSALLPKIEKLEDSKQKGIYYFQYGSLMMAKKETNKGVQFFEEADRILSPLKDNENVLLIVAAINSNLGEFYELKKNCGKARIYLEKALEYTKLVKKPNIIAFVNIQIHLCSTYFTLGMVEKSFEAIDHARQFCLQSDYPKRFNIINDTYQNLFKGFLSSNKVDAAMKFVKDYIDFLTQYTPENSQKLYDSYVMIAENKHKEKDFKSSVVAASKALEYAEKVNNEQELIYILQFSSGLYSQIGDFSLVINYLDRLKQILNDQSKNNEWVSFYYKAFIAYKKLNLISETIDSGNKLISCIQASEKPDYGVILTTQITIAETFASINKLDESFKYVKASEETAIKGQGENGYYHSKALHHIGLVYKLKGEYDTAREYFTRALEIIIRIFGNKNMESFHTLDMLVSVSHFTKNWKDLVEYAQKRFDLLEENKKHTEVSMIATYLALGEGFAGQKNITIAKYNFEKLKMYCLEHGKANDALIAEARIKQLKEE